MLTRGEKKNREIVSLHAMQLQCTMFVHCDFVDMDVFGITPNKRVTFLILFWDFFLHTWPY